MSQNGIQAMFFGQPMMGAEGWHLHALSEASGIDAAASLLCADETYAQLAAEDTIEVLSSDGNDITQYVTLYGIDNTGRRISETLGILTGATAVTSTNTFRYIENAFVDAECAGTITVRRTTGDTFITEIAIGQLSSYNVQHFPGERQDSYITMFAGGPYDNVTDSIIFELRWYPDDADCVGAAATTGYMVLDRITYMGIATLVGMPSPHYYPQPIRCPAGGWIAVYALAGAANMTGWATLQGFDLDKTPMELIT